jgi:hypothetical protein
MMMMIMILTLKSDVRRRATFGPNAKEDAFAFYAFYATRTVRTTTLSLVSFSDYSGSSGTEVKIFFVSTSLERTVERPRARPRRDGGSREEKPFALL